MTSSVLAAFLLPLVASTMAIDLPYFCSFEDSGLCGMEHGEGGDFNWTRQTGGTPSDGTGPDWAAKDSYGAVNDPWYMYIESSDRVKGDKAYIQTPAVEYTGDLCIRFMYHMNGQHIGRLVVFVDTRGENSTPAFNKNGHQNIMWHRTSVNVVGFKTGERVVFMAECGDGYQGDIAIDVLHIANGTCHDCQVNNGGCDHICLPQGTWTICSCHEGYIAYDQRCKQSPTSTPPKTSTSPSTSPSRSSSSTTNRPDPPILSNTTSTLQRTTASSQPPSMTTSRVTGQQTDYFLWQVIVAVVVLALIAFAGIVVYLKRRTMASQATEPGRVYYENDAALTSRPTGDVTKPADEPPYEDVECPRPATQPTGDVTKPADEAPYEDVECPRRVMPSAIEIQTSPPRSDPEDLNPGGYEDLEPYEPHVGGPYDIIM